MIGEAAPVASRLELLTSRAAALSACGELGAARETLVDALALMRSDAGAQPVGLISGRAAVEHLLGEHAVAHDRLLGALGEQPSAVTEQAAALYVELAADALFASDFETMQEWTEKALGACPRSFEFDERDRCSGDGVHAAALLRPAPACGKDPARRMSEVGLAAPQHLNEQEPQRAYPFESEAPLRLGNLNSVVSVAANMMSPASAILPLK